MSKLLYPYTVKVNALSFYREETFLVYYSIID